MALKASALGMKSPEAVADRAINEELRRKNCKVHL
jgi:hypothetical protein